MSQDRLFQRPLTDAMAVAADVVDRAKAEHDPKMTFLLFSGGNDSTVVLDALWRKADAIVHINTGIGIPAANEHARKVAAEYPLPFIEMHPPRTYEDLVLNLPVLDGMPGPGVHHVIYSRLKERCVEQLLRDHRDRRGQRFLLLTGVRRSESKRRMGYSNPVDRKGGQVWVNPLLDWQNDEMEQYRSRYSTHRSEVADNLHMSGECLCGAMADQDESRSEIRAIEFFYPTFAKRIHELEKACRDAGKTYVEWGIKRHDVQDLETGPLCAGCEWRQQKLFEEGVVSTDVLEPGVDGLAAVRPPAPYEFVRAATPPAGDSLMWHAERWVSELGVCEARLAHDVYHRFRVASGCGWCDELRLAGLGPPEAFPDVEAQVWDGL